MRFRRGLTERGAEEREAAAAKRRSVVGCDCADQWIRGAMYRILLEQASDLDRLALLYTDDVALSMLTATDRVLKQHRRELQKERARIAQLAG